MTAALERTTNGHGVDLEELYRQQRTRLVGVAAKTVRNAASAEDAVQDVFADMIDKGRRADNPIGYLVGATRNRAVEEVRHITRVSPGGEAVERTAADPSENALEFGACMGDPKVAAVVGKALSLLTENQRVAVEEHCLNGRRVSEVAQLLGISTRAVYDRINAALVKLRAAGIELPDMGDDEPAKSLAPNVKRALEVLRSTYGAVAPAGLPGTSELARRHGWDTKKASSARAAYTGALLRPRREPPAKVAKKAVKATPKGAAIVRTPAPAKAAPAERPLPVEATPVVTPVVAEAWLSTSDQQVTCMFVNSDESTTQHPAVFRSMAGAQREITGHLVGDGYKPTGPWVNHSDDESSRNFSKKGN